VRPLSVRTSGGTAVPATVRHRGAKITGTLKRRLGEGRYRVSRRAASDDGHRLSGSFSFRVR
jgi:methionine-rich copper-binding protein CopC